MPPVEKNHKLIIPPPLKEIVINLSTQKSISPDNLLREKRKTAAKYNIAMPTNSKILEIYRNLLKSKKIKRNIFLEETLKINKVRSLSGIVVVSVLTKPYSCPGKCLYCPTQKNLPKSYLNNEPAVMRAISQKFDPYLQVKQRLKDLINTGHHTQKISLRTIGGTWSHYKPLYQKWFIKRCFDACNDFGRNKTIKSHSLLEAQKKNEKAGHRLVEISVETRPDFIDLKEIKWLRELGVTKVELGIQSIYDDVLKINKRGHNVKQTISATKLLKDAGFKISFQVMPNLLSSNIHRDKAMFKELFNNPDFKPDHLKIYPMAVLEETPIYHKLLKDKKFKPYNKRELVNLLKSIKKEIPYYCRIERIMRDIPLSNIIAGAVKISNLREAVLKEMEKKGLKCKCIRCREAKQNCPTAGKIKLFRCDYEAAGGKEIFLSFESPDREKIYSLLRLRFPSQMFEKKSHFLSMLKNAALIREIHTYGQEVPIFAHNKKAIQHKGLGKRLMKEAEKIVYKEFNLKKIAVISGVGARNYFRKLGYRLKNTYMVKKCDIK